MKVYTLQIGKGAENSIDILEHSETLGVDDLLDAISQAKVIINSRAWRPDSNLVRLLEELDGDSQIMWFRPMAVVRNSK